MLKVTNVVTHIFTNDKVKYKFRRKMCRCDEVSEWDLERKKGGYK